MEQRLENEPGVRQSPFFLNQSLIADRDIRTYSPLTLAWLGDAVYELVIRSYIAGQGNAPVDKLHHKASSLVKAQTQSEMAYAIRDQLSEEELAVYKRGRNAHSYTRAKNASMSDYRRATGFEALMGYLYLTGRYERMLALIRTGVQGLENRELTKF